MFGDEYYDGPAPLPDQGEERAGSARGDPADRLPPARRSSSTACSTRDELRLYELIWKRTMASQMVGRARAAHDGRDHRRRRRTASRRCSPRRGKAIEFAGFRRAYVEGSDDPAAELEEQETVLPTLHGRRAVDRARWRGRAARAARRSSRSGTRHAAGALHRSVADQGARAARHRPAVDLRARRSGRSSGAATCSGRARRWCPSFTAFAVTQLLREHFGDYVDVEFTAEMEEDLDADLARRARVARLHPRSSTAATSKHRGLEDAVEQAKSNADYPADRRRRRSRVGRADPRPHRPLRSVPAASARAARATRRRCPTNCAPADLTVEKAMTLLRAKAEGPRALGVDPETGQNVYVINGRFGAYVQLGETPEKGDAKREAEARVAAAGGMTEIDGHARRGAEAARRCRASSACIRTTASRSSPGFGRFGPYVKHGDDYRSLERDDERVHGRRSTRRWRCSRQPKQSRRRQARRSACCGRSRRPTAASRCRCSRAATVRTSPTARRTRRCRRAPIPTTLTLEEARALLEARARRAAARAARGRRRRGAREAARRVGEPPTRAAVKPQPPASASGSRDEPSRRQAYRRARRPSDADPHRRRRPRRIRSRLAGRVARRAGHAARDAAGACRPRCTRPIGSPSWSAATRSAATSSITPSAC